MLDMLYNSFDTLLNQNYVPGIAICMYDKPLFRRDDEPLVMPEKATVTLFIDITENIKEIKPKSEEEIFLSKNQNDFSEFRFNKLNSGRKKLQQQNLEDFSNAIVLMTTKAGSNLWFDANISKEKDDVVKSVSYDKETEQLRIEVYTRLYTSIGSIKVINTILKKDEN